MRRNGLAVLALAPLLALGLAGCGSAKAGGGAAKVTAQSASVQEQARQFAKCMRGQGIDMPDPEVDPEGGIKVRINGGGPGKGGPPGGSGEKKAQAAEKVCRRYLPNGGTPPPMSPEDEAKLRQFAKCMREHGIDMPDPEGGRVVMRRKVDGDKGSKGSADAKLRAADQACRQYKPGKPAGGK